MISDDLTPAVAWVLPTKKTTLFIARLGNQAINPVGKAHATIHGRYAGIAVPYPPPRRIYLSRKSMRKFFASLRLTLLHHKS